MYILHKMYQRPWIKSAPSLHRVKTHSNKQRLTVKLWHWIETKKTNHSRQMVPSKHTIGCSQQSTHITTTTESNHSSPPLWEEGAAPTPCEVASPSTSPSPPYPHQKQPSITSTQRGGEWEEGMKIKRWWFLGWLSRTWRDGIGRVDCLLPWI